MKRRISNTSKKEMTPSRTSIHFIGIGGIGVSALAKYYLEKRVQVTGSDLKETEITKELAGLGAKIKIGPHHIENLPKDTARIIYTSAVPKNNPEYKKAQLKKIPTQSYAEAIGDLTKKYETITISGSHGKSTTTALSALVLEEGFFDPTVIVGTKVKEFGNSNFRKGLGPHLVLEADEWNKSFLNYSPKIAVFTNIDAEHLDTYKDLDDVKKTFLEYTKKIPKDGALIANFDDPNVKDVAWQSKKKVIWYSQKDRDAKSIKKILQIPGAHNLSNALAAVRLGSFLGIPYPHILRAISNFRGVWRRFELKGMNPQGAYVISDYGHHPKEILATISGARERFPLHRIWCVYQPHQYQRLQYLWNDFKGAFDMADRICLLPVYDVAGRETKEAKKTVDSEKLTKELIWRGKLATYHTSFDEAKHTISNESKKGDVILVMGAGDIYALADELVS
jgi:UDP-N-acetylmuramate--alanine ligase